MTTRIIFMGTPDFAVPSLNALINASAGHDWQVIAAVTQPDRPKGRGKQLAPSPVKVAALTAGVKVFQPPTLKTAEAVTQLAAFKPDVIVVAAFGQILRENVLNLPPHGCINVHASLLPRWRGASPVTAAIQAGDAETGVTIMQMDEGMDTGAIIARRAMPITSEHTGGTLTRELAELGAALLVETLPDWLAGRLEARPQDESRVTMTRLLKKQDGAIDWAQSAAEIERQVRAFSPWPGTFTSGPRGPIKVLAIETADLPAGVLNKYHPGVLFKHAKKVYVAAGQGAVRLAQVQPAGKKVMSAEALLNGQPDLLGTRLN